MVLVDYKPGHAMKLQIRSEDRRRLIKTYFNEWLRLVQEGPVYT